MFDFWKLHVIVYVCTQCDWVFKENFHFKCSFVARVLCFLFLASNVRITSNPRNFIIYFYSLSQLQKNITSSKFSFYLVYKFLLSNTDNFQAFQWSFFSFLSFSSLFLFFVFYLSRVSLLAVLQILRKLTNFLLGLNVAFAPQRYCTCWPTEFKWSQQYALRTLLI